MTHLRARVWNSIFTHDMRRYLRSLFNRMENVFTLITGPSGSGKELLAQAIGLSRFVPFNSSSRKFERNYTQVFYPINLSALSETLIESELFGHQKGAFTGALQNQSGYFESCGRYGTVFLDEIGEMPLNLQVKLLRVLQESELTPVGATASVKVDVRIIAATNRDLADAVKKGGCREDLYYRINVLQIAVPPLRDRHRDVLLLAGLFIKKYTSRFGLPDKAFSLPVQAKMLKYPWPGNIRQLENIVQKALLVSKGNLIVETDLELHDELSEGGTAKFNKSRESKDSAVPTLKEARLETEKQCIREALKRSEGNITVAARLLDTDRKWLTKLMKTHGIESNE